jgi:hypothetical protein
VIARGKKHASKTHAFQINMAFYLPLANSYYTGNNPIEYNIILMKFACFKYPWNV